MNTNLHESALICAIIGHLVGDYLLQNDWMALNKKRAAWPCVVHCLIWTWSVLGFSGWFKIDSPRVVLITVILFATHFAQDRTQVIAWWMRLKWKDQSKFMECDRLDSSRGLFIDRATLVPGLGPWSIIVVDNVWHIVTLWAIWRFLV